jgi:hypothetical protein
MDTGYPIVHRMTQAEFNVDNGMHVQGGFIEIVGANGIPTGPVYLAGAPGAPAQLVSVFASRLAGENISAFNVVYDVDGVSCRLASSDAPSNAEKILGLAINTATTGNLVGIIRSGVYAGNTGFTPGMLFLGINGNVTHGPATSGVHVQVGNTISSTVSDIDIKTPIYL